MTETTEPSCVCGEPATPDTVHRTDGPCYVDDQPVLAARGALSAKLWAIAEHHIVAEWICCEPLDLKHELCAKGYAALGMAKTLLVDSPEAWNPAAPLLDAVLAEEAELRRDRDLAIAHDRQPYPTAWAYEQACAALHRKTEAIERVRSVLESEAVVGRSALDYRGLITSALMADDAPDPSRMAGEAQQPEADDCCGVLPPELFIDDAGREWHAGDCWCTLAPGHGGQHRCQPCTDRVGAPGWTDHAAVGAQQPETQAENPARIDRLRPEFTDHASVESIDAQLRRARSQLRRWHLRVEWLISLRQARVEQKERGEWPAVEAQQPKEA